MDVVENNSGMIIDCFQPKLQEKRLLVANPADWRSGVTAAHRRRRDDGDRSKSREKRPETMTASTLLNS